jgi:FkbM family methyltransferase
VNFSGISRANLLGKALRLPLRMLPKNLPVPILQGRLRGYWWIAGASTHGCWLGSYENEKRKLFEQVIGKESVVFDIGANVGFYTLLAAAITAPKGKVVAFEPLPRNLALLRRHLALNKISNVIIFEAAVTDRSGTALFVADSDPSMAKIATSGKLKVKAVALDDLVSSGVVPAPTHLKIDVEGAEARVLLGAEQLLRTHQPQIFLSTHGAEVHQECCERLIQLGYSLRPIGGADISSTDEILAVPVSQS